MGKWRNISVVFLILLTALVLLSACKREINPTPEPKKSDLIPVKIQVLNESGDPVEDVSLAFTDQEERHDRDIDLNVERTDKDGYTETKLKEKTAYDVALVQGDGKTVYTEVKIPDDLFDDTLKLVYDE